MKALKILGVIALVIVAFFAYFIISSFMEGYHRGKAMKEYNQKTLAVTNAENSIMAEWKAAVKSGQDREKNNYYVSDAFRTQTDATVAKLRSNLDSLPPASTVPSSYSAIDTELRQQLEAEIKDLETMSAASKARRLDVIGATIKSFDARVAAHNTRMKTNAGQQPGWGK